MKNAICMLAFKNESYIVGACLAAYAHKKFIEKLHLEIDLVLMIDESLASYKNDLLLFFNKVVIIDLFTIKLHINYKVINKYSEWMKYSVNKWQVLKLIEYDKVLFIDIDILPYKEKFYDIFDINTPAILNRQINLDYNEIVDPNLMLKTTDQITDYHDAPKYLKHSLDAGIVLFKPSIELYNEYISFLKFCEGTDGYISLHTSGVDETTMTLFLFSYKKMNVYGIPYEYASVPWDRFRYNKNDVSGINFTSMIKPWLKIPMIQWADENIWHVIANKALPKSKKITKLYLKLLLLEVNKFYQTMNKNLREKSPPYNMEALMNPRVKNKTIQLLNDMVLDKDTTSNDVIKYLSIARKIHKDMKHQTVLNMDSLMKVTL